LLVALAVIAGCGGASAPSQYHYGDMFEEEASGYGGGRSYAPAPPPPSPVVSAPAGAPMEPQAEMAASSERPSFGMRRGRNVRAEEERAGGGGFGDEDYDASFEADEPSDEGSGDDGGLVAAVSPPSQPPAGNTTVTPRPQDQSEPPQRAADTPTQGPLLIYEATLDLAVHEVRENIDAVAGVTVEIGGFVLSQDDTSIVIRVPAGRFAEVLERIEALGDVLRRSVLAEDVSDQVRDLRIRLRNAIQMRDRLLVLLEQAQTVPESLVIEHELQRLNETIALIRGQLEDFQERISFSTITVRFQPVRVESEVPRERFRLPFAWLDRVGLQVLMSLPYDQRRR
jgi:hypothetical protein